MIEMSAAQLVNRADIFIRQAKAREAAAIGKLFVRGPTKHLFIERFCFYCVRRGQIDPAELPGCRSAK